MDTNIFVRHFAQDSPDQSVWATAFLKRAEAGSIEITVTETVLLELEHVLTSRALPYQLERSGMVTAFRAILGMAGLRLSGGDSLTYRTAVELYAQHPNDFGDALLIARTRQMSAQELASFDRHHFDRIEGLNRIDLTRFTI